MRGAIPSVRRWNTGNRAGPGERPRGEVPVSSPVDCAHAGERTRFRGEKRRGGVALVIGGLIDVAESDPVIDQSAKGFFMGPTAVPHFGHQREIMKCTAQMDQKLAVFFGISKTPRKLHEKAAQFPGAQKRPQPFFELSHLGLVQNPVMSEPAMELGAKEKLRIIGDLCDP